LSRLPSSRGSSAATTRGAGAAAQRRPGVFVQAPKSDIYVALLGISLAAIVLATLLMVLLFSQYGFSTKISAASTPPAATRVA
jgi:ABC-type proline/glycine betaine transport system substrate-binding protein